MERFTIGDAAELAGDVGPDQRLIAVLAELDGTVDTGALQAAVAERAGAFPLLSHRFVRHGRGTWRTRWERVAVDPAQHVLDLAADDPIAATIAVLVAGLPETIPPWRLFVLRSAGATWLLFVAHHVLLDGVTAVAVVGALLGADPTEPSALPRPRRSWLAPVGALAALTRGSPATSLLTPLTSGFRLATIEVELEPLRDAGHRAGATVNDLLLLAVADALRAAAARRGERLGRVVVSVPTTTSAADGPSRNRVGGLLVAVPERRDGETDAQLLGRLAARTRRRKRLARAASGATVLSPALTALGRLGWYRPLFERQRAITTLVTNLRGPASPLPVLGTRVRSLTPISPTLGNVTVVFAALSYAGRFRITLRLDRSAWDVEDVLTGALRAALARLARSGCSDSAPGRPQS